MAKISGRELRILHACVALSLVAIMTMTNINTIFQPRSSIQEHMSASRSTDLSSSSRELVAVTNKNPSDEAWQIVNKAYAETFAEIKALCPDHVSFRTCIRNKNKERGTTRPWWFQTMLRDAVPRKSSGVKDSLFGEWHELYVMDPPLKLCVMEKVGTKQWRKFQCKFNAGRPIGGVSGENAVYCQAPVNVRKEDAPRSVFIRDPLERFLSAFLDKCWNSWLSDSYCKPREIFGNNSLADKTILYDEKTFFETYVDTMPLKWDLHFFPQSFYCDGLYRHYKNYDFVGNMDIGFYDHLETFGSKFNVSDAVEEVFQLAKHRNESSVNLGVETAAAKRVHKFYNARTVRRVLQYVSMDYILFDLPIPKWATEILVNEEAVPVASN
ncbi:Sulfotransferase family [Seminavis robusta]|uniref:Sulfotransferase family n=1 Tax=Seminavis robusta TaxID=568900 RepID=A0A9N8DWD2_9STRA|nr:Sulfotransferase family [Seminavis robusta]|eukprot:Sro408_g136850.1 Sulfotransferase family (383) ;mRNA; r:13975-15208